jgi:hypothetical protein
MHDNLFFSGDMTGDFLQIFVQVTGSGLVTLVGAPGRISGSGGAVLTDLSDTTALFPDAEFPGTLDYRLPIIGYSISLGLRLTVAADCEAAGDGGTNCNANLDYFHTAVITGLDVVDASGVSLKTPFSAESGTVYPTETGTAVPEPASLSLTTVGLLAFVTHRLDPTSGNTDEADRRRLCRRQLNQSDARHVIAIVVSPVFTRRAFQSSDESLIKSLAVVVIVSLSRLRRTHECAVRLLGAGQSVVCAPQDRVRETCSQDLLC